MFEARGLALGALFIAIASPSVAQDSIDWKEKLRNSNPNSQIIARKYSNLDLFIDEARAAEPGRLPVNIQNPADRIGSWTRGAGIIGYFVDGFGNQAAKERATEKLTSDAREFFARDSVQPGVLYQRSAYHKGTNDRAALNPIDHDVFRIAGGTRDEVIFSAITEPQLLKDRGREIGREYTYVDREGKQSGIARHEIERVLSMIENRLSGEDYVNEMNKRKVDNRNFDVQQQQRAQSIREAENKADAERANQLKKQQAEAEETKKKELAANEASEKRAKEYHEALEKSREGRATKEEQERINKETEEAQRRARTGLPVNDDGGGGGEPMVCDVCVQTNALILRSDVFVGNYRFWESSDPKTRTVEVFKYGNTSPIAVIKGLDRLKSHSSGWSDGIVMK